MTHGIFTLSRVMLVIAAGLCGVSMRLYPGGTSLDPTVRGYSFFLNSLSDLGATVAWNGEPNKGSFVQLAASVAFAVGGCTAVLALIPAYSNTPLSRRLARLAGTMALVSVAGLIGVGLTPWDRYPVLHGQLTLLAVGSCPAATALLAPATGANRTFPKSTWINWVGLTIVVLAWMMVMRAQPATNMGLAVPVTLQKTVALGLAGTIVLQTRVAERVASVAYRNSAARLK